MQQFLMGMMVVLLCCAPGVAAGEGPLDARLQEAQTASDEADTSWDAGRYADAIARGERALVLREAVLGSAHPEVARSLDWLGSHHLLQGNPVRAGPLLQRALAIREAALGKDHPEVAQTLTLLANLYSDQRLYARAEPFYVRALAIREAAFGKNHLLVAASLNGLAKLYQHQILYARSEPLFLRALAIREASLGQNHLEVAQTLNDLGESYMYSGLYARAEPLFLRALAIREASLGQKHPDVAVTLLHFSENYAAQGVSERARPLVLRAIAVREAALDNNPPNVADSLFQLAGLYLVQGWFARAELLYVRTLALQEATVGKNHPLVAETLYCRAAASQLQGLYGRAEPLFQRALAIRGATSGENHPRSAEALNHLAVVHLAQHRLAEALPLLTRAFAMSERRLRQETLGFSEVHLSRFLQFLRTDEERLYALLRAHPDDARVRRLALGAALLLKGRSVEETADISRTLYRSLGAQDRETFERLGGLRSQLAQLSLQGPGSLSQPAYQQRLHELSEQGAALEADLASRSAPLRALTALPSPAEIVDRVAAALSGDGALVEFITYVDRPLVLRPQKPGSTRPPSLRYLALVLFPDSTTRTLDLGPAEPIDSAALRLRDALANRDAAFEAPAQALYQLVFQPLLPLLGETRRLFLSPDGQLALVPFAALHDGHQFLVDAFDFTYLSSGKDLLPRSQERVSPGSVVVLANPDFNALLPAPAHSQADAPTGAERSIAVGTFFSTLPTDEARRAWALTPLPGTLQEAEAIQRLLPQAQLFLGPEATKERLMHLPTPGILHLATHGFFLGNAPESTTAARAVKQFGALGEDPQAHSPADPLLRSGLVFAGARASASSGFSPASSPDSTLVTALELAGLDLWGTQLVVLSACDTGRGDIKLGQGVYGLRRAFLVAGAETVVMSLWKVNDETTSTLMEAYYRNLLAGQGRAAALREAMRELRRTQSHPHAWAPFIAMGQDAPLRSLASSSLEAHP
ncbi:CHAT domain-containing protein [Corallococcus sicarius]|uniref:CHAT domain-containing protein n=1 Tax=Corallococcus sicarius TaxID=2316726 RepID=A0A3A8P0T4_9BACT|nr:CHAT domain-containing tetratricopeptide repeat protein [Corallococcus sicarius]RKH48151.1 CHAT domain-containing protein [Corallococcus sicarius]